MTKETPGEKLLRLMQNVPTSWLDPRKFQTDMGYQVHLDPKRVERIVENFDPEQITPVVISQRDTGALYIIDGQHRAAAAIELGVPLIECKVLVGKTLQEEAFLYVQLNSKKNRRGPSGRAEFMARVTQKEPEACGIYKILQLTGYEIIAKSRGPRHINSLVAIERSYRLDRSALQKSLFDWKAVWPDKAPTGVMIETLAGIWHAGNGKVDQKRLRETLVGAKFKYPKAPEWWTMEVQKSLRGHQPNTRYMPHYLAGELLDAYNNGLHTKIKSDFIKDPEIYAQPKMTR